MGAAQYERSVKMTVGYKLSPQDLATFLSEINKAGMDPATAIIHWSAHEAQDQRDQTTLTLTAMPGAGR